jgi:hypothetical protein
VRSKRRAQRNMFSLAGWLFADMFFAMMMIFLMASAVGTYKPLVTNVAITPTPHLIGMNKVPAIVKFSVDGYGLLNSDPTVVAQVKSQVQSQLRDYLRKHNNSKAAFVSTFGGGLDDGTDTSESNAINAILQRMGKQQHYVFDRGDTVYNAYIDRADNFGAITINVFFYLYTT